MHSPNHPVGFVLNFVGVASFNKGAAGVGQPSGALPIFDFQLSIGTMAK
jgi:hypothetical protein